MRSLALTSAVVAAWLAAPEPARAQLELSRRAVVERALASSPAIAAAEARVRIADARLRAVRGFSDPMLSARLWGLPTRFDGPPSQTMLMAEQTFPLARVARRAAAVESASREAEDARVAVARHLVAMDAELALVAVCEAEARLRAIADTRALYGRLRDVAVARALVMPEDAIDVAMLEVEASRTEAELAEAQVRVRAARRDLATTLDVPVDALGACGALDVVVTEDDDALVARALEARPELEAVLAERARADAMTASVSAMSAPMLQVGAGVMLMPEEEHVQRDRVQWMLEAGVSIPAGRGARAGRRAEARAMAEEADAMRLEQARTIERDVRRLAAMRDAERARDAVLARVVAERLATALDGAIARYRIDGDASAILEILRMRRELETERVDIAFAIVRADVELAHAVGLGLPEDGR